MSIIVTQHAIDRYRERVASGTDDAIIARLSGPAFAAVSALGRGSVKLPTGHRAIVDHGTVVTVLPKGQHAAWVKSHG